MFNFYGYYAYQNWNMVAEKNMFKIPRSPLLLIEQQQWHAS